MRDPSLSCKCGPNDDLRLHIIYDLQPYQCTYEDCFDANRLYGSHQEWLDHENQHARVWHCHHHSREFPTPEEYIQHLDQAHPDTGPEQRSSELVSAAAGPSLAVHRPCPLCPTPFEDVSELQRHLRHHLERLALFSLPHEAADEDEVAAEKSSDSHQVVQGRGRAASLEQDFDDNDGSDDPESDDGPDITETITPISLEIIRQQTLSRPTKELELSFIHGWIEMLAKENTFMKTYRTSSSALKQTNSTSRVPSPQYRPLELTGSPPVSDSEQVLANDGPTRREHRKVQGPVAPPGAYQWHGRADQRSEGRDRQVQHPKGCPTLQGGAPGRARAGPPARAGRVSRAVAGRTGVYWGRGAPTVIS